MSIQKVDIKNCAKVEKPHPCDPPPPCDPLKEPDGECEKPFLCLERLKHPAGEDEITRCQPGPFMNVQQCKKEPPPHPCDPPPPCKKKIKHPCNEPALCLQRIKNPEPKKVHKCPEVDSASASASSSDSQIIKH